MKKILIILVSILSFSLYAQAPQGLNYQATVRNSSGNLITNQNVYFRFNIMQNSATSVPVYTETHYVPTDDLGQVNCVIGQGTATTGTFSLIDWSNGTYFLGIELNIGSDYLAMGTTQFLSVPYALYAGNVAGGNTLAEVLQNGNQYGFEVTPSNTNGIVLNVSGGNTNGTLYCGLNSTITGYNGFNRAIQGVSAGGSITDNEGVLGAALNSSTDNIGVYGLGIGEFSQSQYNTGVKGEASAGIESYGIRGLSGGASNRNHGVAGYARNAAPSGVINTGVFGGAENSEGLNYCVWGGSNYGSTTNGTTIGVLGSAISSSINGSNYGIYGTAGNAANNYAGFFDGNVTVTGNFVNPSDRKLKRDISPFHSALDKIALLNPVTYYYDVEKNKTIHLPENKQYGFVAQDLEAIFPDLVTNQVMVTTAAPSSKKDKKIILNPESDKEGNEITPADKDTFDTATSSEMKPDKVEFKGINYIGLISILTEGIKEQQDQIKVLKDKNEDLEKRLLAIEALLKK